MAESKTFKSFKTLSGYGLFCQEMGKNVVDKNRILQKYELLKKLGAAWQQLSVEEKQNYKNRAAELRQGLKIKTPVKTPTKRADLPIKLPNKKRRLPTEPPSVCPKSMKHWLPSESDKTRYLTRDFVDFNNRIERQSIRFAEQKEQLIKENAELANKLNMINRHLSLKLPKETENRLLIQKYMWHIYIYKLRLTDALKELPFPDNQDMITVENVMDFYKIAKQIKKDNLKSNAEFISKFNKAMCSLAVPSVLYLYE
ncbi:hypothetical protein T4C_3328 [Trichinella pseudospiralis]|uniref:HMG box domain-containing protein n=1 Tax=Trichinella pseudospiralis TaxID=6337 RepID=A0A0V1KB66_TRIPS|nr:hypothetical protein T4C_3328 [Trichinella pseudospiralis]